MHEITQTTYAEHIARKHADADGFTCPVCGQWTKHEHASQAFPKIGDLEALCLGCEADALGQPLGTPLDRWASVCGTTYQGRIGENPRHVSPWMDPHAENERRGSGQRTDPNQHKAVLASYFQQRGLIARAQQGQEWREYRTARDAEHMRNEAIRQHASLTAQKGRELEKAEQHRKKAEEAEAQRQARLADLDAQIQGKEQAASGGEA